MARGSRTSLDGLRQALRAQAHRPVAAPQSRKAERIRAAAAREKPPVQESAPPSPADPADPADLALFQASVRDVKALKDSGRADVQKLRPPPLPRPRNAAVEGEELPDLPPRFRPPPADDDAAAWQAALEAVQPLAHSNRAELLPPSRAPVPHGQHAVLATLALPIDTNDPAALFRLATQGTLPLTGHDRIEHADLPRPAPEPRQREEDEAAALRESLENPLTFDDRLDLGDEAAFLRSGLPRRVLLDLRRGRWVMQDQLDLHGLTRHEARDAMRHFLHASLTRGHRCVRIIHGKGHGSPGRESILKYLSRGWLAQREEILAFCQARVHQGGGGALVVLLRAERAGQAGSAGD